MAKGRAHQRQNDQPRPTPFAWCVTCISGPAAIGLSVMSYLGRVIYHISRPRVSLLWAGSAARLVLIYMSDSTRFGRGCVLPENLATNPFMIDRKCRPRAERSHKIGKAGWLSAFYWEDMAQEFSDENRLIMHLPAENTVPLACGSHRRRPIGYKVF